MRVVWMTRLENVDPMSEKRIPAVHCWARALMTQAGDRKCLDSFRMRIYQRKSIDSL
jgi:hypothetical protein